MRISQLLGALGVAACLGSVVPAQAQDMTYHHHRMHRMMHHDRMMARHDHMMMRHDHMMMRHHRMMMRHHHMMNHM